jgi:hypothetical protein
MNFVVHELPRAKADKRAIFIWIIERSPQGGVAWLTAYDDLLVRLEQDASSFGKAMEDADCPQLAIHQALFKTRHGRVYRVLYFMDGSDVYVLRVRGPGQAPVDPGDLGQQSR